MKGEGDPLEHIRTSSVGSTSIDARPAAARARLVGNDHVFKRKPMRFPPRAVPVELSGCLTSCATKDDLHDRDFSDQLAEYRTGWRDASRRNARP